MTLQVQTVTESRVYKTTAPMQRRQRQHADAGSRRLLQDGADSPEPVNMTVYNGDTLGPN